MKPEEIRDLGSTIAGGGAGLWFLSTVNWQQVLGGETTKMALGVALILLGYLYYRASSK